MAGEMVRISIGCPLAGIMRRIWRVPARGLHRTIGRSLIGVGRPPKARPPPSHNHQPQRPDDEPSSLGCASRPRGSLAPDIVAIDADAPQNWLGIHRGGDWFADTQ